MLEYQSDGAPLLIADVDAFALWTGTEHDGSEITVEYMSDPFEALPGEFKTTTAPGMQVRKFATVDEAEAFERKLFAVLIRLHPEVADPPEYPDASHSYIGEADDDRRFSMERAQGSMFNTFVLEKNPETVKLGTFEKKNKAKGILLGQLNGGGGGFILADGSAGTIVIAVPHDDTGETAKVKKLLPMLRDSKARTKAKAERKGKGTISLGGRVIIYDSGFSHREVAKLNWKKRSFLEGATAAFAESGNGPLKYADSDLPGGAFLSVPGGDYAVYYQEEANVGGSTLQVLWLVRE
jgi:hypothetical protein